MPEQTLFVRSDQYSFVRQGVPSVWPPAPMRRRWRPDSFGKTFGACR
jgi:hypothetical protein